jgi:c-di-GMP phosphodiesterase
MTQHSANSIIDADAVQSLFAAQPIFDKHSKRVGVELLYRGDNGVNALELGDNLATSEVVCNLCSGISTQINQYNVPVYINVCADFLLSGGFLPLEADQVIIELVERITPSAEFIARVSALKQMGYRFALDDFEFTDEWEPLIALADIIKVDILTSSAIQVKMQKHRLREYPLTWLAERVETQQQFEQYQALGFSLFQGYFLARPELVTGKKVPSSALRMAELINNLFQQEPDINKLAALLNDEPTLVLGMLRIANSPLYRKTREVSSVKEVIVRLGLDLTKKWILIFSLLKLCTPEATSLVLSRAYSAQALAEEWHVVPTKLTQFFLTALLSGVDILFGVAPAEFITHLNVSSQIKDAISLQLNEEAKAVKIIKSIEKAYSMKTLASEVPQRYFLLYNAQQFHVQEKLAGINR